MPVSPKSPFQEVCSRAAKLLIYCSLQNVFAMFFFANKKINYDDQNVEIWRRSVQCRHELTFLRGTRDATSDAQT